jgi:hypothetical protein
VSAPAGPAWGRDEEQQVPLLTEEQRRTARAMAGLGVSRRHIAMHLRLEEAVLIARMGEALELAEVEANSKVAKALFTMATQKNNVAAAIFWMKARSGWREKVEIKPVLDGLSHMSDAELEAEIQRLERAVQSAEVTQIEVTACASER